MTPEQIAQREQELSAALKTATDLHADVKRAIAAGEGAAETKEQAAKAVADIARLRDELASVKSEATERQDAFEVEALKRLGARAGGVSTRAALEDGLKAAGLSRETRDKVEVKVNAESFLKDITNVTGSGGPLLTPDYVPGIQAPGQRRITLPDLVASGRTSQASVTYMRELAVTDNTAVQATQGSAKGNSDFTFEAINEVVATIAHYGKISRQMMDDVPALVSYIEGRMRYMLDVKLEQQMLTGTGANGQIQGMVPLATAFDTDLPTDLAVTGVQILDVLGMSAYQVSLSEFAADGYVINPLEGWKLRLLKDGEYRYLFANPADGNGQLRPWGIPAVETQAQTADNFLTGAFRATVQLFTREDVIARLATENEDDFINNLVTLLVEMRAVQAVYRPLALVKGTFTAALAT